MFGKIVLYKMRKDNCGFRPGCFAPDGSRIGNQSQPGDLVPAIITRVWPGEFDAGKSDGYNITVFPDGPTPIWATSVKFGDGEGELRLAEEA
jgi:hypothetical protein